MKLPPHYDPANAERWSHSPEVQPLLKAADRWREEQRLAPASGAERRVHLLMIDVQKDFCFPEGTLYVAGRSGRGALDDNRRTAELLYRNLDVFTEVTATLDSHLAFQIFFTSFWVDPDGCHPEPHREVTLDDLDAGRLRPDPRLAAWLTGGDVSALEREVHHYCESLERGGRYRLYLWPPHCLLGTAGHGLAGVIQEAQLFWAFARGAQAAVETKGEHPLTEHYSVFRPEVSTRAGGGTLVEADDRLLSALLASDALVIVGQAASHCVKSSVDDLVAAARERDPALLTRLYLVEDCMSAVTVPDGQGGFAVDYTPQVEAALDGYREAGVNVVRSSEPMERWPGFA